MQLQETLLQGNQNAVEYLRNLGQVLGGADLQNYAMLVQTIKRQASVMAYNEAFLLVGLMLFLASLASLMIRPPAANATASMAGH